jgi:hypothetical protein
MKSKDLDAAQSELERGQAAAEQAAQNQPALEGRGAVVPDNPTGPGFNVPRNPTAPGGK